MYSELLGQILAGNEVTIEQALSWGELNNNQLNELFLAALQVTRHFHGNQVDLCAIVNAKSGFCSEDCAFCAQSVCHHPNIPASPIPTKETVLERAYEAESNVRRFSLVTSGRGIGEEDFKKILEIYEVLRKKTHLGLCASLGIIGLAQARSLYEVGVTMYHHNIETSRSFFPKICTTHNYDDRLKTIHTASEAGLNICSGGIIGLGETWAQRVEMAFQLKELGVMSSAINILIPIVGTPLQKKPIPEPMEVLKTVAMFRVVLPGSVIRLCGGRPALRSLQPMAFTAGVNGMLVGNYLTTAGREVGEDIQMLRDLEIEVARSF